MMRRDRQTSAGHRIQINPPFHGSDNLERVSVLPLPAAFTQLLLQLPDDAAHQRVADVQEGVQVLRPAAYPCLGLQSGAAEDELRLPQADGLLDGEEEDVEITL